MKTSRRIVSTVVAVASCSAAGADIFGPSNYQDPAWMDPWYAQVSESKSWADWATFGQPVGGTITPSNYGWNFTGTAYTPPKVTPLAGTVVDSDGYLYAADGHIHFTASMDNKADPNKDKRVSLKFEIRSSAFGPVNIFAMDNGTNIAAPGSTPTVLQSLTTSGPLVGDRWIPCIKEWKLHPQPGSETITFDFTFTGCTVWIRNLQMATACPSPGALLLGASALLTLPRRRTT